MPDYARRFPSVADMKAKASKRIPDFAWQYLIGGIGPEDNVARNEADLRRTQLMPRYLSATGTPDITTRLFDQELSAPFGVAPMGLNGLIWPGAEPIIASAAKAHGIVYALSTHATQSIETMKPLAGAHGWFQLYPPNDPAMETDMISRARKAGYTVLVVTVDIPTVTRRDRDIRNGLSVPPQIGIKTVLDAALRPAWLLRLARFGIPHFENLEPYAPKGLSITALGEFLGSVLSGHITLERLKRIRDQWPGKLVVKGVLDPEEAAAYLAAGADGIIVSNHGGRQLDAAPTAAQQLPAIRAKLGPDALIMADGGIRSGLDIARMLALGADYVFLGRPFIYAASIGDAGPSHLISVLKEELSGTMAQIGCGKVADLNRFLHRP